MDIENLVEQFGAFDPKLDLANYKYPVLDLLAIPVTELSLDAEVLDAQKKTIVDTLLYNNVRLAQIRATIGPTLTLFEITSAPGVRVAKIKNLEADLALYLAAEVRVTGPIPGKGTMGIEVPHPKADKVMMRSLLATKEFLLADMDLPVALGKTMDNEVYITDLAKLPHLLIAGATGQGKSVCLNALLVSLLYKKHPSEVKFVLIDINQLELSLFHRIERHFLAKLPDEVNAVVTDPVRAIDTLNGLCMELDERYELLKNAGVRHIREYNQKFIDRKLEYAGGHRYLPFIVLVIEEFAELLTPGKGVEIAINRLAQLGRPAGIHLVIATQRPSKVITGTIKANFTSRLAFRVSSNIDSRTILDASGAEMLKGQGDMLLATGTEIIHLQGVFVDTTEVERIAEFIGAQRGYPCAMLLPEYISKEDQLSNLSFDPDNFDPLFEDCARLIVLHQQGSTSLIQRKLKLGYNRAGRIIDQLEAAKVVGPFDGSKAREVLYIDEYSLELFLSGLKKNSAPVMVPEAIPAHPELVNVPKPAPRGKLEPKLKRKGFWGRLFN